MIEKKELSTKTPNQVYEIAVKALISAVCVNSLGVVFFGEKISSGFG